MRNILVLTVVLGLISAEPQDEGGRNIHGIMKRSFASYRTRSSNGKNDLGLAEQASHS